MSVSQYSPKDFGHERQKNDEKRRWNWNVAHKTDDGIE